MLAFILRILRRGAAASALLLAALPAGGAAQTTPDLAAIERYVTGQRVRHALPGLSIVVMHEGRILHAWGDGVDASGAPMTPGTRVYIGSASKAFTGVATMQLADAGRIDLDAPVQTYLPEFTMRDPRATAITVRQLLTHTSGMTDQTFQEWGWPQPRSLEEAVARLANARLGSEPGTRFSYHNPNYHVAARLVEVVSGQPFAEYLEAHVFAPLGMTNTNSVGVVHERRDGAPLGHIHVFGRRVPAPHPPFFIEAAGGIVTTADDMGRWLAAQANGGAGPDGAHILSAQGMAQTHAGPAASPGYGFGWNIDLDGRISHSGGLATYSAYVTFFDGGDGVAVMTPAPFGGAREIALGVLDLMQGRTPPARKPPVLGRIDVAVAATAAAVWFISALGMARAHRWARRARLWRPWRVALGFLPQTLLLGLILFGLPFLVSRVESWSWIWLFYYLPVWTTLFLSIALTALLVAGVKLAALFRARAADTMAPPA